MQREQSRCTEKGQNAETEKILWTWTHLHLYFPFSLATPQPLPWAPRRCLCPLLQEPLPFPPYTLEVPSRDLCSHTTTALARTRPQSSQMLLAFRFTKSKVIWLQVKAMQRKNNTLVCHLQSVFYLHYLFQSCPDEKIEVKRNQISSPRTYQ